jgi:hypothetical protein
MRLLSAHNGIFIGFVTVLTGVIAGAGVDVSAAFGMEVISGNALGIEVDTAAARQEERRYSANNAPY